MVLPFVAVALGLAWWAHDSGLELAGFYRGEAQEELSRLRDHVGKLQVENVRLSSQVAAYERQAQIEHASNLEVANQMKSLSEENIRLQEDLAFFQNLTFSGGKEGEISIQRLRLERDTLPGEYRCRFLLVQGGKRAKEFQGSLQFVVNAQQGGKRVDLLFPQSDSPDAATYQLNFKYYQRVERSFQLPPDTELESVQVRLFDSGAREPRVRQSIQPS